MTSRIQEFVADDLWLLIGIVTFGLISLAGLAGLEALAGAVSIVGWFVLTPIFLFWGEEIAAIAFEEETTEPRAGADEAGPDPLEELKRRYAAGEIDDAAFERRLQRLVAVEEIPADALISDPPDEPEGRAERRDSGRPARGERKRERDREPEREQ